MKKDYERQIQDLYAEIGRLTTQLSWLKKIWHSMYARSGPLTIGAVAIILAGWLGALRCRMD